jgi:hypothetical protein
MTMAQPWTYGVWTYRSFYNRADPVAGIDDLLLAEGEMVFDDALPDQVAGQLAFRSDKPDPSDARLALAGSLEGGSPGVVRFRGVGNPSTAAKGWIYDYVGYLVPSWPSGVGQRRAIVGSVTRAVDHPGSGGTVRPAGQVFSFVAVERDVPEASNVIPIADPVLSMLASRHHRLHHLVWHTVRNSWNDESTIPAASKKAIDKLGWAPPRPVLSATGTPLFGNGSGEDFLFMHRQMRLEVNDGLTKAGKPPIKGWVTVPPPGPVSLEPDFSEATPALPPPGNPTGFTVPGPWLVPGDPTLTERLTVLKRPDFYWSRMRWWDRQYKDPAYLATLSLGELGTLLEWTIHNDMHMRWTSVPRDPQTHAPAPGGRQDWDIDPKWDDAIYDHLGEQYSSHVNPVFWRLHGWVDDRIEDWFAAREAANPGGLERRPVMGVPWFQGDGVDVEMPWSGPMDMHAMMSMDASPDGGGSEVSDMEQIIHLLFPPPANPALLLFERASIRSALAPPLRKSHF